MWAFGQSRRGCPDVPKDLQSFYSTREATIPEPCAVAEPLNGSATCLFGYVLSLSISTVSRFGVLGEVEALAFVFGGDSQLAHDKT